MEKASGSTAKVSTKIDKELEIEKYQIALEEQIISVSAYFTH